MKNRILSLTMLFALTPFVSFAHGFSEGGWDGHMGFMGSNWGNHMGFMGGGLMMILWIGLLVFAIYAIVRWIVNQKKGHTLTGNAYGILAERYAKGEITLEEFTEIKKQLK